MTKLFYFVEDIYRRLLFIFLKRMISNTVCNPSFNVNFFSEKELQISDTLRKNIETVIKYPLSFMQTPHDIALFIKVENAEPLYLLSLPKEPFSEELWTYLTIRDIHNLIYFVIYLRINDKERLEGIKSHTFALLSVYTEVLDYISFRAR